MMARRMHPTFQRCSSSVLMWDAECAMTKKKKKNATSRVCDEGWREQDWKRHYSRHWEISIVKKVLSFFLFFSPPKIIRLRIAYLILYPRRSSIEGREMFKMFSPRFRFKFRNSLNVLRLDFARFCKLSIDFYRRLNSNDRSIVDRGCIIKRQFMKTRRGIIERNSILSRMETFGLDNTESGVNIMLGSCETLTR